MEQIHVDYRGISISDQSNDTHFFVITMKNEWSADGLEKDLGDTIRISHDYSFPDMAFDCKFELLDKNKYFTIPLRYEDGMTELPTWIDNGQVTELWILCPNNKGELYRRGQSRRLLFPN